MTAVRLAYSGRGGNTGESGACYRKAFCDPVSTVRLAFANRGGQVMASALGEREDMSTVRLAYGGPAPALQTAFSVEEHKPALLVSYVYLKEFLARRKDYHIRDWVMDSGAFSAWNAGTEIKLQDFIDTARRVRDEHGDLTEVFALDVIGDWKASIANTEEMWRQGVEAIPTYHLGEPVDVLKGIARDYPKIAIGGMTQLTGQKKLDFIKACFHHVWPKKIHGLGCSSEKGVLCAPWHSVDASSWEAGPTRFGTWDLGKQKVHTGIRKGHNLRSQVDFYLRLEKKAKQLWKREMAELEAL